MNMKPLSLPACEYSGIVTGRYPFLISIPHGGTDIPAELEGHLSLSREDIRYYSDPDTCRLFDFRANVQALIDTNISRMAIDLNRPPLPLPPRNPDGIIKVRTIDGTRVYRPGRLPDLPLIHQLMMHWYFPYHQRIDELIDRHAVQIAFDCHSMLPVGSVEQKDAGQVRPLICLGNNGDLKGRAKKKTIATCPAPMIEALGEAFREEFSYGREVAINNPFSGGFISNAHYWRKGTPWIQIEINRSLYEPALSSGQTGAIDQLRERIWRVLATFWDPRESDTRD
jgi:formiminoglutamase